MAVICDEALAQLIRKRLMEDRRTAGVTIEACCSDGCICLIGTVDTLEQSRAAQFIIEGMSGVRSVMNNILVRRAQSL